MRDKGNKRWSHWAILCKLEFGKVMTETVVQNIECIVPHSYLAKYKAGTGTVGRSMGAKICRREEKIGLDWPGSRTV